MALVREQSSTKISGSPPEADRKKSDSKKQVLRIKYCFVPVIEVTPAFGVSDPSASRQTVNVSSWFKALKTYLQSVEETVRQTLSYD